MRIGFVVQRYSPEVIGGAERHVQLVAEGLAREGHDVEVLTSCAASYVDWRDEYEPGTTSIGGVNVLRLPVVAPRDNDRFFPLHQRAIETNHPPLWPWSQDRWTWQMGPALRGGDDAVAALARRCDVTVMFCYHYSPSMRLTRAAAANGPTCLQTTAHPEGAFQTGAVRPMMQHADVILCNGLEEASLVHDTTGLGAKCRIAPCPVDQPPVPSSADIARFRDQHGLGDHPYLAVVGRLDAAKGSFDAVEFTRLVRRSTRPELRLVVVGERDERLSEGGGVIGTGFLSEVDKAAAIAGASVFLQPSYMESLSIVLLEGWLLGRPALVNGRSAVLAGHVARSGGGLAYRDFDGFEAGVETLLGEPALAKRLAANGSAYATANYRWDVVRDRYLAAFDQAISVGRKRLGRG